MRKNLAQRIISLASVTVLTLGLLMVPAKAVSTTSGSGVWLKGDFHTHTLLSDASYTASQVAAKAKQFGLDWYSAADHGGGSVGTLDQNGLPWGADSETGNASAIAMSSRQDRGKTVDHTMPRWGSIAGIGEDEINKNRSGGMMQISGFEWNVPTHEHAAVGMVGHTDVVKNMLAQFNYRFDNSREVFDAGYYPGEITTRSVSIDDKATTIVYAEGRGTNGRFEAYLDKDGTWKTNAAQNTFGTVLGDPGEETARKEANQTNINANLAGNNLTTNNHLSAIMGAEYLQENFPDTSYFLPNHPTRAMGYTTADLREFNDAAPDVCFGAEFLPGHQASAFRGGLGRLYITDAKTDALTQITSYVSDTNNTVEKAVDAYIARGGAPEYSTAERTAMIKSGNDNLPKLRTYGGADYMLAKVGGTWDALLSEGRRFWAFGNSDFHHDKTQTDKYASDGINGMEPDFWPGEYTKLHSYAEQKDYQGILDSLRSGNSYTALGDLINALDYTVSNNSTTATMGETITPIKGKKTTVTVSFKSPDRNNNGQKPVVDHIDLIAGEVTGIPQKFKQSGIVDFTNPKEYLSDAYQKDSVSTTRVIKRFNRSEFKTANGWTTVSFDLPATSKDMYYRLRGTNNSVGSANCDASGNPTIDSGVLPTNTIAKAYADLWFYSNPIFVNGQAQDGVAISGTIRDEDGDPIRNQRIMLNGGLQRTRTDANGRYRLSNVEMDMNTLALVDSSVVIGPQNIEREFSFNLQRGDTTRVDKDDIWVKNGISAITLDLGGRSNLEVTGVKEPAITVTQLKRTATPGKKVIPKSKTVKKNAKIKLTAPKETTLYYTSNGKKPTTKSNRIKPGKSKKLKIKKTTTVRVMAIRKGRTASKVAKSKYTVKKVKKTTKKTGGKKK
ncbi:MAG: chitobiase/beta-hexosaminidase C-terminal domain-containing protein [Oscillospiraceae bacterium]|nr:chitobiase/beta-hexosaminidase C-terminal domain-containing protein [Oscillospiraceae bacterium]